MGMYFVEKGTFAYHYGILTMDFADSSGAGSQQSPAPERSLEQESCKERLLHRGDWSSEAALWTLWQHRGSLVATSPTTLLLLSADTFVEVVRRYKEAYVVAKSHGKRFVLTLNSGGFQLSDLGSE